MTPEPSVTTSGDDIAVPTNGVELMEALSAETPLGSTTSFPPGVFTGYVTGVASATSDSLWCPQDRVEYLDAVREYLEAHPERWSEPALPLILDALRYSFPCDGSAAH